MNLDVAFRPLEVRALDLADTVCIVLDIFRATTCMTTALHNGCAAIVPVLSMEEARETARLLGPVIFAGERQSLRIEGCELGNSPFDFSPETVRGRTVVTTTTNGTVAIKAAAGAYRTLIGSFLNAAAVCREARRAGKDVLVVCAGTEGFFSLEDALCAGLLVQLLAAQEGAVLTDAAQAAALLYEGAKDNLVATAVASRNGRRLQELGRMDDVACCFRVNTVDLVPEYRDGAIRPV